MTSGGTNVTYPMLDQLRKRLRMLVPLIERSKKVIVYADFTDAIGDGVEIELPGVGGAGGSVEFVQFRKKAETFLKAHLDEAVVAKVRSGEPLTAGDITNLQRILVAAGIRSDDTFAAASEKAGNFGLSSAHLSGSTAQQRKQRSLTFWTTSATAATRSSSSH